MYKSYSAYAGSYAGHANDVGKILNQINESGEKIVSVTPRGQDNIYVLIITETGPNPIKFRELSPEEEAALAKAFENYRPAERRYGESEENF